MTRTLLSIAFIGAGMMTPAARAQVQNFKPVTTAELANPSPNDWLSFSRTYDDQRFSPLNQITRQNVSQLRLSWSRGMPAGTVESTPLVRGGTMYIMTSTGGVEALNATNGDLLWEYTRPQPAPAVPAAGRGGAWRPRRTRGRGEHELTTPAPRRSRSSMTWSFTPLPTMRWWAWTPAPESCAGRARSISAATLRARSWPATRSSRAELARSRSSCYISAHDARTGKELWKFYTTPAAGEPGGDSWADEPDEKRVASTWGSPGAYDPVRDIVYYGIANPTPNSRIARHNGNPFAIPTSSPSALYSNSTVALDGKTGKLLWYFQHLPGDDWDEDWTNERTLIHTKLNPNPKFVKWINPKIKPGEERDTIFAAGESGGIFLLDRLTGEFLWANPFPYDAPNFWLKNIDVNTGKTYLNEDLIFRKKGEEKVICFFNTRSYWPAAYSPLTNSMYVPYIDACLDNIEGGQRKGVARAGADPQKLNGIGKINMETGEILRFGEQRAPANGAVLATAGNLIFWGDLDRRLHAFDAVTGKQLWEGIVGGSIAVSTITYAVNGKQYVAILTGNGALGPGLIPLHAPEIKLAAGHNAVYVFALP